MKSGKGKRMRQDNLPGARLVSSRSACCRGGRWGVGSIFLKVVSTSHHYQLTCPYKDATPFITLNGENTQLCCAFAVTTTIVPLPMTSTRWPTRIGLSDMLLHTINAVRKRTVQNI
ncbi:hypothetical protein E2C01_006733 [Portunus trituberculatus]|uniref:Uncharacterized protein n=1 Tax=Portunus trituberculatus TaxID=210409 RepID=A0A5B7CX41_PORTR|nr:hypothetical protein [Portunus trituberculatus]